MPYNYVLRRIWEIAESGDSATTWQNTRIFEDVAEFMESGTDDAFVEAGVPR
jgi:hypothetical protein